MTECTPCATAASRPHSGLYDLRCVACCARLVLAARPDNRMAGVALDAIARVPGAPSRVAVLAAVKNKGRASR